MRRMHGVDYPDDLMFPNKKAIRIKVKLPSSDRRLFHWPAWSRKRMSRQWLDALHKAGGPRWRPWYLYFGVVPPYDFLEVLDMPTGEPAAVLAEADQPCRAGRPPSGQPTSRPPSKRLWPPASPPPGQQPTPTA